MCIHVDIFWSGTEKFTSKFVESIKESFSIGAYNTHAFKYIDLNIVQKKWIEINQLYDINILEMIKIIGRKRIDRVSEEN